MKFLLVLVLFPLFSFAGDNFHEIDPGKYYRSAQLSKSAIKKYTAQYGIKTIINLRGASPKSSWYKDELAASKELGIEHYDIAMDYKRLPHKEDLVKLLDLFKDAPRPILLHCHAGKDRTGEASAIYVQEYMGWSKEKSLEMLTRKYNYTRWIAPAKYYFIDKVYENEQWARESYEPCQADYKYYNKEKYCKEKNAFDLGISSILEMN